MSIATKTGDTGTTALMYNRRFPKPIRVSKRAVPLMNSMPHGVARATAKEDYVRNQLLPVCNKTGSPDGRVGNDPEDLPRYTKDGFARITPE